MFCSNCGSKIPEDAQFCGNCGTPVKEKNMSAESADRIVKESKKRVIKAFIVVAILVIVLGIAGITYYNLRIRPQKENPADDERYWASDEFDPELHDFVTEDADFEVELSLTYTRVLCGRFDFYVNYYDETGSAVNDHYSGVFDEDLYGNGVLKFDTGEECSYFVDYGSDPVYLIFTNETGETLELIELI